MKGAVKVDEYVTHNRTLAEINEGFHDMHVSVSQARLMSDSCSADHDSHSRAVTASVALLTCRKARDLGLLVPLMYLEAKKYPQVRVAFRKNLYFLNKKRREQGRKERLTNELCCSNAREG